MSGSTTLPAITQQLAAFRRASTRLGDTMQVIALRELGDAARWPDLVALNGLLPPYITDSLADSSATVLWAGQQTIKVPAPRPAPSGVADVETVFGIDASLANGRLDVGSDGDLLTISGPDNLKQALTNRLGTRTGDLIRHPDYGCDVPKLIGRGVSQTTDQLAVSMVARAIRSDPRVASVEGATGTIVGDRVNVAATAVSVDGKRVPTGIPSGTGAPPSLPQTQ